MGSTSHLVMWQLSIVEYHPEDRQGSNHHQVRGRGGWQTESENRSCCGLGKHLGIDQFEAVTNPMTQDMETAIFAKLCMMVYA